jgi:hypothetical protein
MKEAAQPGNGSGFRHTETVEFAGGKLKRFVLGNGLSLLFLQDKQGLRSAPGMKNTGKPGLRTSSST